VTVDTELGGVHIPPVDARAVVDGRQPRRRRFPIPTTSTSTDPTRHHVGFGWGIHLCVNAPSRIEAKVAFEQLLARTTSFSVDPPPRRYVITSAS
jgi:cytochrome P450